mmetsp:Transcript_5316/g.7652  ORF Transcript_5316/g.7652 Transcript_5316/m.7652 type:complete len:401 (+) Transcript_5316:3-1205(+)
MINNDANTTNEMVDFGALKVVELRQECKKHGIDSSGLKRVLVDRLIEVSKKGMDLGAVVEEQAVESEVCSTMREGGSNTPNSNQSPCDLYRETNETVDFGTLKVVELRKECKKRGIDTSGTKQVLVNRLTNASMKGMDLGTVLEEQTTESVEFDITKECDAAKKENEIMNFSTLKVVELQDECKKFGVDETGTKQDDRLIEASAKRMDVGAKEEDVAKEEKENMNFSTLKVVELREECKKCGIDDNGTKQVLVNRLIEVSKNRMDLGAVPEEQASELEESDATKKDFDVVKETKENVNFSTLKVAELREECKKHGIDSCGTKQVLVNRLRAISKRSINHDVMIEEQPCVSEVCNAAKETNAAIDFSTMKVVELRAECKKRGIDAGGNKKVLIERLKECVA